MSRINASVLQRLTILQIAGDRQTRELRELVVRISMQRVRLGRTEGLLLNLSATGALVRVPTPFAIDADVSLAITTDDRDVHLPCRVVRCTESAVGLEGATWRHTEFDIGLVFDPHSSALQELVEMMDRQRPMSQQPVRP